MARSKKLRSNRSEKERTVLTNLRFRKLQETIMDKWKMSIGHLQEI
jgi:hypothetical protein